MSRRYPVVDIVDSNSFTYQLYKDMVIGVQGTSEVEVEISLTTPSFFLQSTNITLSNISTIIEIYEFETTVYMTAIDSGGSNFRIYTPTDNTFTTWIDVSGVVANARTSKYTTNNTYGSFALTRTGGNGNVTTDGFTWTNAQELTSGYIQTATPPYVTSNGSVIYSYQVASVNAIFNDFVATPNGPSSNTTINTVDAIKNISSLILNISGTFYSFTRDSSTQMTSFSIAGNTTFTLAYTLPTARGYCFIGTTYKNQGVIIGSQFSLNTNTTALNNNTGIRAGLMIADASGAITEYDNPLTIGNTYTRENTSIVKSGTELFIMKYTVGLSNVISEVRKANF